MDEHQTTDIVYEENEDFDESQDDMDDPKEQTKTTISEKVDGLLAYRMNLPLSKTLYVDFAKAMQCIEGNQTHLVLKELKDHFSENNI